MSHIDSTHNNLTIYITGDFHLPDTECRTKIIVSQLCHILAVHTRTPSIWIAGDFNLPDTECRTNAIVSQLCHILAVHTRTPSIWIAGDFNLPDTECRTNAIVSQLCHILAVHTRIPSIWIAGDFNLPDTECRTNKSIIYMIQDSGAEQMADFPTRKETFWTSLSHNRPSLVDKFTPNTRARRS